MENRIAVLWRTAIWHILAFYGNLAKFNQIWVIFGALGSHENRSAVLQDLTRKSCGSPENRSAVLHETLFYGTPLL